MLFGGSFHSSGCSWLCRIARPINSSSQQGDISTLIGRNFLFTPSRFLFAVTHCRRSLILIGLFYVPLVKYDAFFKTMINRKREWLSKRWVSGEPHLRGAVWGCMPKPTLLCQIRRPAEINKWTHKQPLHTLVPFTIHKLTHSGRNPVWFYDLYWLTEKVASTWQLNCCSLCQHSLWQWWTSPHLNTSFKCFFSAFSSLLMPLLLASNSYNFSKNNKISQFPHLIRCLVWFKFGLSVFCISSFFVLQGVPTFLETKLQQEINTTNEY